MIPLPDDNRNVTLSVALGGTTVVEETLNPSLVSYWKVSLTGEGIQTASIYYDGSLYKAYSVDFTEGSSMIVTDNSSSFNQ